MSDTRISQNAQDSPLGAPSLAVGIRNIFRAPRTSRADRWSYYLILGPTLALTAIGLLMVFSASSVEQTTTSGDPFGLSVRQFAFAALGIIAMMVTTAIPLRYIEKTSWWALVGSMLILAAVPFLGSNRGGNTNWISVAGLTFQPSELVKLTLILWMATVFATKKNLLSDQKHLLIPVLPVATAAVGFILLGHDLGTAVMVMIIAIAGLYFAGVSRGILLLLLVGGLAVAGFLAAGNLNRVGRIGAWLGKCDPDPAGYCDQALNGMYALSSGGWFGVGLGQSRQKWNWIPEAHNDFIFAVIGEELGLLGTLLVIALYAILACGIFRVMSRRKDIFSRVLCGSVAVWVIGQAFVNIGMVTGILPVIGVPLPLISYGGTALVVVLAALGVVLALAKYPPPVNQAKSLGEQQLAQNESAEAQATEVPVISQAARVANSTLRRPTPANAPAERQSAQKASRGAAARDRSVPTDRTAAAAQAASEPAANAQGAQRIVVPRPTGNNSQPATVRKLPQRPSEATDPAPDTQPLWTGTR